MKESYKIVLKHWAKNHPTFFWAGSAGLALVLAVVWFGFIGPIMYQSRIDILIWAFNIVSAIIAIIGFATFMSIIND